MKKNLSLLGTVSLTSTVSFSVVACNNNKTDPYLYITPEGWDSPKDKILKTDIKSYTLKNHPLGGSECTLNFYLNDKSEKWYPWLNGFCSSYWEPYLIKQLGYGPTV